MATLLLKKTDCYRGTLILVNRRYPLHSIASLQKAAGGRETGAEPQNGFADRVQLAPVDEENPQILMDHQAARVLRKALEELGCRGGIVPVSGYRSRKEQEQIYRDSLEENGLEFTKQYVALPDRSEHQTGLAIDLGEGGQELDFIRPAFPEEGICGRFGRAATRYGFILRYPQGKEKVTGIACEPWHFRYVGYPHSLIMEEKGMVLEEYLDFLCAQPGGIYKWQTEGRPMEIRYIPADPVITRVKIPDDCLYQISGDNREGFILTIWRKW